MEFKALILVARLLDPRGMRRRLRRAGIGIVVVLAWWYRAVQVAEDRRAHRQARAATRAQSIRAKLARDERELRAAAADSLADSAGDGFAG